MFDYFFFFVACPLVFLAGFIDAVGGGGGFISHAGVKTHGLNREDDNPHLFVCG